MLWGQTAVARHRSVRAGITAPAPAPVAGFNTVTEAATAIAAGQPVVVVDAEDRENEGDLIIAAELASTELLAFMIRYSSGIVCVPMAGEECDRLDLPLMVTTNQDSHQTAFTVSVDAADGISTGVSAADRARTIRALAGPVSTPADLTRPGHVFPLRAVPGGVLTRPGHTEAGVDLVRLAGLRPAAAICEIINDDGTMARLPDLQQFARDHGLCIITIEDLVNHQAGVAAGRDTTQRVRQVASTPLPLPQGIFQAFGYRDLTEHTELIALVHGDITDGTNVLTRIHSGCLTGDAFGSLRCDCGPQLQQALDLIAGAGAGVLLYVRDHEGRGIGLLDKLRAYQLQDNGADTVDANLALGLPIDSRRYEGAAAVLADIGVTSVRLITNNPAKHAALESAELTVTEIVRQPVIPNPSNLRYLTTKRNRMFHQFTGLA
jgi:3,4-dihydroxy 2-butanone 4-phosphate synthase/GTP cyclohydrolase II